MINNADLLEKVLLKASDDALYKCYTSCSEEARVMTPGFWRRKFIQEFGPEKGHHLSSHPYSDLGMYYFHKKYHNFRGNIFTTGNASSTSNASNASNTSNASNFGDNDGSRSRTVDLHSLMTNINNAYYWQSNFKVCARFDHEHLYIKIVPVSTHVSVSSHVPARDSIDVTIRENGNFTIVGCNTHIEIQELCNLIKRFVSPEQQH